jgi:hypothetical protein
VVNRWTCPRVLGVDGQSRLFREPLHQDLDPGFDLVKQAALLLLIRLSYISARQPSRRSNSSRIQVDAICQVAQLVASTITSEYVRARWNCGTRRTWSGRTTPRRTTAPRSTRGFPGLGHGVVCTFMVSFARATAGPAERSARGVHTLRSGVTVSVGFTVGVAASLMPPSCLRCIENHR